VALTLIEGSEAISTTEWSCASDTSYDTGDAETDDGVLQVFLDTADMVAGDQLQIRIYEKVQSGTTQRVIYEAVLTGTMAQTWVSPALTVCHGWDVTLDALAGTITVYWSLRLIPIA
jgi:hypothetical protein